MTARQFLWCADIERCSVISHVFKTVNFHNCIHRALVFILKDISNLPIVGVSHAGGV